MSISSLKWPTPAEPTSTAEAAPPDLARKISAQISRARPCAALASTVPSGRKHGASECSVEDAVAAPAVATDADAGAPLAAEGCSMRFFEAERRAAICLAFSSLARSWGAKACRPEPPSLSPDPEGWSSSSSSAAKPCSFSYAFFCIA